MTPQGDKTRQLTGMGRPFFPLFNRGKKSVQLDTSTPEGRAALDRLLATADVFVDNFRDQSLARMGADPTDLRARFPGRSPPRPSPASITSSSARPIPTAPPRSTAPVSASTWRSTARTPTGAAG